MGGVRIRRTSRILPRHGWDPVVLTHRPDSTSVSVEAVPRVRVEEVAAPDLASLYRKLKTVGRGRPSAVSTDRPEPKALNIGLTSEINRWLMIPDKQMPWRKAAVRRGRELLKQEKFSAIFASLDPRTSLLVAAQLSKESGVPCVFEYRDLWIGNPYYHINQPTGFHRWLHRRLERKAVSQARKIAALSRGIADHLTQEYSSVLQAPVELNYNFFDPDEYPKADAAPAQRRPFTITYTGAMYASRTPHQFFEGMRAFIDAKKLAPHEFRFRWAGGAAGIDDLGEVIERTGVRPYMDFLGLIPHRDALRSMMQSDAALLLQAPDDAIHIPGKLFETMGAGVPVLVLAHPCEVTEIVQRCRAGIVCPHSRESVASALAEFHALSLKQSRWEFNEAEVQKFSADASVGKLAELLNQASG